MNRIAEINLSYKTFVSSRITIASSSQSHQVLRDHWDSNLIELQEEFKVLLLNRAHYVLGIVNLSKGGTSGTIVDPKLLFAVALKSMASSIILAHNHPSGNLTPSQADRELTNKVQEGCKMLDIKLLDHLIISTQGYLSFADHALI